MNNTPKDIINDDPLTPLNEKIDNNFLVQTLEENKIPIDLKDVFTGVYNAALRTCRDYHQYKRKTVNFETQEMLKLSVLHYASRIKFSQECSTAINSDKNESGLLYKGVELNYNWQKLIDRLNEEDKVLEEIQQELDKKLNDVVDEINHIQMDVDVYQKLQSQEMLGGLKGIEQKEQIMKYLEDLIIRVQKVYTSNYEIAQIVDKLYDIKSDYHEEQVLRCEDILNTNKIKLEGLLSSTMANQMLVIKNKKQFSKKTNQRAQLKLIREMIERQMDKEFLKKNKELEQNQGIEDKILNILFEFYYPPFEVKYRIELYNNIQDLKLPYPLEQTIDTVNQPNIQDEFIQKLQIIKKICQNSQKPILFIDPNNYAQKFISAITGDDFKRVLFRQHRMHDIIKQALDSDCSVLIEKVKTQFDIDEFDQYLSEHCLRNKYRFKIYYQTILENPKFDSKIFVKVTVINLYDLQFIKRKRQRPIITRHRSQKIQVAQPQIEDDEFKILSQKFKVHNMKLQRDIILGQIFQQSEAFINKNQSLQQYFTVIAQNQEKALEQENLIKEAQDELSKYS
ncbi:UNKNOWN [Stylonychia lemnae]|uniref:Dynein heavy chain ATP-binding dynein motor region domain-containing protein n=1 Tax=Stylonychia lemnae TaxID=5949 RepID=A0A078B392_STYLE|nr:UNKNOWN [Stylonychia lemnae]|eukprot:CDW88995.1 UNKNOWN [Stylonychia lemnae]